MKFLYYLGCENQTQRNLQKTGDSINVSVGSQSTDFIPVPKYDGNRIIGDVDVEISIEPPEAASVGYNIESVGEEWC